MPANPTIDIAIEHDGWTDDAVLREIIEKAVSSTIEVAQLKLTDDSELSVLLTGDAQIQTINKQWRKIDKPTNVLSFPGDDVAPEDVAGPILGDIIIAHETVALEAGNERKDFQDHFTHLVVHGFLHLFGYDHENDTDALEMEGLETKILVGLGIADPYTELT